MSIFAVGATEETVSCASVDVWPARSPLPLPHTPFPTPPHPTLPGDRAYDPVYVVIVPGLNLVTTGQSLVISSTVV